MNINNFFSTTIDIKNTIINNFNMEQDWSKKWKPCVIWLTGLSGAGKTTIANELAAIFKKKCIIPIILDGDDIRQSFEQNSFDETSRKLHNLSIGKLASNFESQGHLVIVALISPYAEIRNEIRGLCKNFIEVYVSTDLEICKQRDSKGLYKKAMIGEIKEFTGISAPYYKPNNPEVIIDTTSKSGEICCEAILAVYYKLT